MRAGAVIRARGLNTQLFGICMSACPLVFLGGVERNIFRFSERFGFHKVSSEGNAVPISDSIYNDIATYVSVMGGNADLFVETMQSYEPHDMGQVTPYEECQMGLGNWWQGYPRGVCPNAGKPN